MVGLKRTFKKHYNTILSNRYARWCGRWLPASLVAGAIIVIAHVSVSAGQAPTGSELASYINGGGFLRVGSTSQAGYQQVYYEYKGNYFYITEESRNHRHVVGADKFMAWEREVNGRPQIIVYDAVTRASRIVASTGSNARPAIDRFGNIAWERWDGQHWQIYYYNYENNQITQVTSGETGGIRPDVEGATVIYAQKDAQGEWMSSTYSTATQERTVIKTGSALEAGWPQFQLDGSVTTDKRFFVRFIEPL